jgi:uncharacterized delta-60 repeat protein
MKNLYKLLFLLTANLGFSQSGNFDLSFDNDGKVITDFGTNNQDDCTALAIQTDGKIIAVGTSSNGTNYDFAIARYNVNGSLDNNFGINGKVITAIGLQNDFATSVAIQSDGKIVVAGMCFVSGNEKYGVVRYNVDGTLDTSFDLDGKIITSIGSYLNRAYSIAIQSEGKIIVAGDSYSDSLQYNITMARYNTNGSLDSTFDNDGISVITFGTTGAIGKSIVIKSDGKIVVAGQTANDANFILIRCNINGSLDTSFGTQGGTIVDFGTTEDVPWSMAIQSDGKIVVAGGTGFGTPSFSPDMAIMRCNADGSIDTTFDLDGKVILDASLNSYSDQAKSLAIHANGKILVAGYSQNSNDYDATILRLNTNGSLDTSFDIDGIATTSFGTNSYDFFSSIKVQTDGKIIAAGTTTSDFALARYAITSLGFNKIQFNNISISPNPTQTSLTISTQEKINTINIIDFLGRKTNITSFENNKIDVSNLQNGVYFLEIGTENGLQTQKFIKN